MRLGVIFPQTEIGADPILVKDYAQAAEELGYDHLAAYDHVLGADPARRPGWKPPYTHKDMFHEPFVLFAYLAGLTKRIELTTGVLILPQRQTALVAKQAAAVDVLSGGRMRLGIGIGWNDVEYEALGEEFTNRGRRSEEQIELLRRLWTEGLVTFEGKWHRVTAAGINPLPVRRPIPIWLGGGAEPVLRRTARLGDGWLPLLPPDDKCRAAIQRLKSYAQDAGRNPAAIGIEGRVPFGEGSVTAWRRIVAAWRELGASHISLNTMKCGLAAPRAHIEALRRFKEGVAGA